MIAALRVENQTIEGVIALLRAVVAIDAHLSADSRQVKHGDVFVACPGRAGDGRDYILAAISQGASAVLMHIDAAEQWTASDYAVPVFAVEGLSTHMGEVADLWYQQPSLAMTVLAVTGTNGKTSCVDWLAQALRNDDQKVGVMGTLGVTFPDGHLESGQLTTPDVISVHRTLARLRDAGAHYVAMEASSIGLDQGRLKAVRIQVAGFTNLSRDHLDYHDTMHAYEASKAMLFAWPGLRHVVLNIDDPVGVRLFEKVSCQRLTYSIATPASEASFTASDLQTSERGISFLLKSEQDAVHIHSQALGAHNVSNLLCVAGLLQALGWALPKIAHALTQLGPVDGRLERVSSVLNDHAVPLVVVDYAHTPDALERVLLTLRTQAVSRQGRLWCVMGCGGDRDKGKRPLMGEVTFRLADQVIVTSDNPRSESAEAIIAAIMVGIPNEAPSVQRIEDRAQAILQTVLQAAEHDVILIAGKGHETYQEVRGVRHAFDDRQWAQAAFVLKQGRHIQTDSRKIEAGAVFVALRGDNFDGHDYIRQVAQAGAALAFVERCDPLVRLPQIVLGDTRLALLALGHAWRKQFHIPVIAVTGSNGKTTTKEMISSILASWLGENDRLATVGNLNNELGAPLTLLRLRANHRAAVIELGMNHPGEIAVLGALTQPTVALVNNAQREHQEFMETVEAVARENGAVFDSLAENGVKVFPADELFSPLWTHLAEQHHSLCFGLTSDAQVWSESVKTDALGSSFMLHLSNESCVITLPVPGVHNIRNALAAAACAHAAGAPVEAIQVGLNNFAAVSGRMQAHRLAAQGVLIDDTYNANPDSVRAAIDVLATLPKPRALVLGDMGEVGANGVAMHREVGAYAQQKGIEYLLTLGEAAEDSAQAFGPHAIQGNSPEEICEKLLALSIKSVLVKGSRFMRMERVVKNYLKITGLNPKDVVTHAV